MEENQPQESQKSMTPAIIIGVVILVAIAGFAYWNMNKTASNTATTQHNEMQMEATDTPAQTDTTQTTEETSSAPAETTTETSEVKVVAVEAGSFYYKPNEIRVKKGQKVKITMMSKDMMHDFTIDELNVKLPVTNAGETKSVEFTADQAGTFEFYCSVGEHRKMGQVGKLIVE